MDFAGDYRERSKLPAPVVQLDDEKYILGYSVASLAFKDFGARFVAQLMSCFNQGESRGLVIWWRLPAILEEP